MKRIFNYFLQGVLYIAPIGITAYIIYVIFNFTDNLLHDFLMQFLNVDIPGLGLVVLFLFLVLIGLIGSSILARPFKILFKRILEKVPILNLIYSAFTDLFTAFVGKERKFSRPVLVQVNPVTNLEKMGFLTTEDLRILDIQDKVAVYFPHSYNFSGELFIVPSKQVRPIDITPAVAMKFIVSGGVSGLDMELSGDSSGTVPDTSGTS